MLFQSTKKGERKDQGDYMPVSLTSVPGKMMEIVLGATERHLKNYAVIRYNQPGFTKTKSPF